MVRCPPERRGPWLRVMRGAVFHWAAGQGAALSWARALLIAGLTLAGAVGCDGRPWNDPYPGEDPRANSLYGSFSERPKHLDPARSYSSNEYEFIAQIYEPPLQYHLLARPYRLVPLSAAAVPEPQYLDADGRPLPESAPADQIAFSDYRIRIRPGIKYQPHPALATDAQGRYLYHQLTPAQIEPLHDLADLPHTGTRELTAADYVHQIKRLAAPWLHSPVAGLMGEHILGFEELTARLKAAAGSKGGEADPPDLDLRDFPLAGVVEEDRYSYRIRIKGRYRQFIFWLAMPFFAPMPWEADRFYAQPGLGKRNLSLDWFPIGTGPYFLSENNPNLRMVLERNPNFHGETYPSDGLPDGGPVRMLEDAGKPLPLIDRGIYTLEKETIPYWNKFLQGYYDNSGISSDSFDQAIQYDAQGQASLTPAMVAKDIRLRTAVTASIFYTGFNMKDPVVGGDSERARLLRRAIGIALDFEEFISIFLNGRGQVAQGPIPPGIFGHRTGEGGMNPWVYEWRDGAPRRRSLDEARRLLAQAGYPDGRDPASGQALNLYFDSTSSGPDDKARLNWMTKQFAKLGIQLVHRTSDYNRFQEKMRKGTAQIYQWGWNADYPDPENFLFLLHGPGGKVDHDGENASNYDNPEFNRLFDEMKNLPDGDQRQALIDRLLDIARADAPWLWGYFPLGFSLHHAWYSNAEPNLMANNTLKYRRLDPDLRAARRQEWNQPITWPLVVLGAGLVLGALPAWRAYRRREREVPR